ncbi:class II glutamine amidotransferase [Litoreibacter albidus]|uniref:Glutamine amidotransferase n=1 Tax=Litoreibacter albidus TaxID=670155 RepID=A0A1H3CRU1_9RHOB|nr:class II glutamine amidotransferase [Litoreibacter albidus]SDX56826.1 glutamine amidotransferase [Litoreibacter albidus]
MCRWAAWIGTPIFLEKLISEPEHSLIDQSRNALSCKVAINADGVGVAWYGDRPEPGLYKNVHPAWSDPNLLQLARQVRAPLFLAHVRASTGSATSYNNCHPFTLDKWSFMHNGMVGGFDQLRKRLEHGIDDALYLKRRGATDSEVLFLTAMGFGLAQAPIAAMAKAVQTVERHSRDVGVTPHMRFTGCWSDGETLYAARYASDDFAPSLFYHRSEAGTLVVSEPLEKNRSDWIEVPPNSVLTVSHTSLSVTPFIEGAREDNSPRVDDLIDA